MRRLVFFPLMVLTLVAAGTLPGVAQAFEVSEVVPADSLKGDLLFQNLKSWLASGPRKGIEKWTKVDSDSLNGTLNGDFEFLVYSQSGVLKKVSGAVSFHLTIETKDNKYRYRYSEFVFHYMKQDRNYQMMKTGKTKPLGEVEAKGWQASWNNHRRAALDMTRKQSNEFKLIAPKRTYVKSPVASVKTDW